MYLCFIERNFLYPILFLISITQDAGQINDKFGSYGAALIICICSLKVIRVAYSDSSHQYLILSFTLLFFRYDFSTLSESFLIDYYIVSIFYSKFYELLLKVRQNFFSPINYRNLPVNKHLPVSFGNLPIIEI